MIGSCLSTPQSPPRQRADGEPWLSGYNLENHRAPGQTRPAYGERIVLQFTPIDGKFALEVQALDARATLDLSSRLKKGLGRG